MNPAEDFDTWVILVTDPPPGQFVHLMPAFCDLCQQATRQARLDPPLAARTSQFCDSVVPKVVKYIQKLGPIADFEAELTAHVTFSILALATAGFVRDSESLSVVLVSLLDLGIPFLKNNERFSGNFLSFLFEFGNFVKIQQRVADRKHPTAFCQFGAFYRAAVFASDVINRDEVIRVSVDRFSLVLSELTGNYVNGIAVDSVLRDFFDLFCSQRMPQYIKLNSVFRNLFSSLRDGKFEKPELVCGVLSEVIDRRNEQISSCFLEQACNSNLASFFKQTNLSAMVLDSSPQIFAFFFDSGLLEPSFLMPFWRRYSRFPGCSAVMAACLESVPDAVGRFLEPLIDSGQADEILKKLAMRSPLAIASSVRLLFNVHLIEQWGVVADIISLKLAPLASLFHELTSEAIQWTPVRRCVCTIVADFMIAYGQASYDGGQFWHFILNGLRDVLTVGSDLSEVFRALWAFLNCNRTAIHFTRMHIQRLAEASRSDRNSFWRFVRETHRLDGFPFSTDILADIRAILKHENPISREATRYLSLLAHDFFDADLFSLMIGKCIESPEYYNVFEPRLLQYAEKHDLSGLLTRFFSTSIETTNPLYFRLLLRFLDVTEGRIDLTDYGVPHQHNPGSRLREIALVNGEQRLKLKMHPATCWTAVRNSLSMIFSVGIHAIDMDSDVKNGMRFDVTDAPAGPVINRDAVLSTHLPPERFIRYLADQKLAPICYRILKRLKSGTFTELPPVLSEWNALYFSEIFPPERTGKDTLHLVLDHKLFHVRFLRRWFGLLARRRDLIRGHALELAKLCEEKFGQNPKYAETLELYHACRMANDLGFMRNVLRGISPATITIFLEIIEERDFRRDLAIELLAAPDKFASAARFSLDIFKRCVQDPADLVELCQRQLEWGIRPTTVLCNALYFCRCSFDSCADSIFTAALRSKDVCFQEAAFRLFETEPFLSRAEGLCAELTAARGRSFTHFSGLLNLGCTCYMNAVVQQLCAHSHFFKTFMKTTPGSGDLVALQRLFVRMRFGCDGVLDPREYAQAYTSRYPDFHVYAPQDAIEFLESVIRTLPDPVAKLFEGKTRTEFHTVSGQLLDVVDAPFVSLDLDIMQSRTLSESILRRCGQETLQDENRFFDTRSGRRVDAVFSLRFVQAPLILVCHLRRFYYDSSSSTRQKMDDRFEFETKLILPGVEAQYGLSGVVLHCGTAHEGHYRALIRDDMQWLEIDDAHVAEVSENDALLQSVGGFSRGWNAYLLFYTRVDVPTSSVQLEDIPQRLRAGLVGEVESLAGLASPAAVAFMSRVRSPEVRFRYFLNTLCRVQETDLARSFSGSVLGLAAQYEEHLKEMLSLIHDCPELQDVMLNVLLSGVSQGVLSRFGDMVDLISRKRETVEWFGRFLSRCCRSCPAGLAVLTTVADAYPDRGDDLSGYIHLVDEEHQRLFPLFANNASLVEPLIGILVNKGASWHEIQRFCNGKKTDFELALTCLVVSDMAQPPNGIERVFALPEFLPYVQASRDLTNPKLIATLAKRAELVFYFGLTYQSKPIRKRTLNFIKQLFSNQRNEFPSVCLFRLINAIQKLEPLGDGEDGKYVHFFKAMNWLASIARKEVKAFRGPLIRAHSKLVTTRPGFNRDLLELIRLVVEHFSVTPNDFSELFFAFFKSTARYSETELRKAIRAFLPQFERTAPASLRSVFESNEFITLTRAAIVAQIPEAAQFITFVRVIASKGEPYSVKLSMLLAD